ncbi:hypothetical protein D3C74_202430 [compost metagenome]
MPTSGKKERYAKHRNMKLRMLQYILQLKDLVSYGCLGLPFFYGKCGEMLVRVILNIESLGDNDGKSQSGYPCRRRHVWRR